MARFLKFLSMYVRSNSMIMETSPMQVLGGPDDAVKPVGQS